MSASGRGQVLIPWPNRVQGGAYEFGGRTHQLALDEPAAGNAIHGLVRWAAWTVAEREANRVGAGAHVASAAGLSVRPRRSIEYSLSTAAWKCGRPRRMSGGAVPVRERRPSLPDRRHAVRRLACSCTFRRRTVLQADEHGIPTGSATVDGTEYDFREPRPIGATKLDTAFTDLERDKDGLARVELAAPGRRRGARALGRRELPLPDAVHGRRLPDVSGAVSPSSR